MKTKEEVLIKRNKELEHEIEVLNAKNKLLENTIMMLEDKNNNSIKKTNELIVQCEKYNKTMLNTISSFRKSKEKYDNLIKELNLIKKNYNKKFNKEYDCFIKFCKDKGES